MNISRGKHTHRKQMFTENCFFFHFSLLIWMKHLSLFKANTHIPLYCRSVWSQTKDYSLLSVSDMCSVTDNQKGLKIQKRIKPPTAALCIAVWRMSFLAESGEKPQLGMDAWFTIQPTEPAVTWSLCVIWSTFLSVQLGANRIAQQRWCSLFPFPDSTWLFPCYPKSCCTHSPPRDIWRGLNTSKLWQMHLIWSCFVLNINAVGSI